MIRVKILPMKNKRAQVVFFVSIFIVLSMVISPFVFKFFTVRVGEDEVLVSANERAELGLHTWPDGNIGVIKSNEEYIFYGTLKNDIFENLAKFLVLNIFAFLCSYY